METGNPLFDTAIDIINKEIKVIKTEFINARHQINDLSANNDCQKEQITIMRHPNEAYETVIDRSLFMMFTSVLINFITIGWIVYSAF